MNLVPSMKSSFCTCIRHKKWLHCTNGLSATLGSLTTYGLSATLGHPVRLLVVVVGKFLLANRLAGSVSIYHFFRRKNGNLAYMIIFYHKKSFTWSLLTTTLFVGTMASKEQIRRQGYQRAHAWHPRRKKKKEQESESNVARAASIIDGGSSNLSADGSGIGSDVKDLAASDVDVGSSNPVNNPLLDVYVVLRIILKRPEQKEVFQELQGSCDLACCKEEPECGIDERPQLEVLVARGNLEAEATECIYDATSALVHTDICNCLETEWGCKYCGMNDTDDKDEYRVIRFNSVPSSSLSNVKGKLAYMLTKSFCQDMFEFDLRLGCQQGPAICTALVAGDILLSYDDHVQMNMACVNPKLSGVCFNVNGHPFDLTAKHAMIPGINGNDDNEISPPVLINGGSTLQCLAMSVPVTCRDDNGDHIRFAGARTAEEGIPGFHSPWLKDSSIDWDKLSVEAKVNRFRLP